MTSKEIVKEMLKMVTAFGLHRSELTVKKRLDDEWVTLAQVKKEDVEQIEKDLEVLEILKPRVCLKDSTLKNAHFTIDENGLPVCENDLKEVDVAFIETSGFVFKNSGEYELLKEWLENDK